MKKTLNPYWNESFEVMVTNKSVLAVQIFDQKKFKKKDQGFLGTVNIQMGDVFDVNIGGDEMLTTELKKSGSNDVVVQGKLIINISSNTSGQAVANGRLQTPSTAISHNRSSSVISGMSSSAASSSNQRNSAQPASSSSLGTNGHVAGASASITAAANSATNGGRQLSAYEDQHGPLPPNWERRIDQLG
ncbi:hypothetical protein BX616_003707, partial [Lobosporangium transversale]